MERAAATGPGGGRWAASSPEAAAGRLAELVDKYERLVALRRGAAGRSAARRDAMRAIAERFPAALREWDTLPLEELERRGAVARQAQAEAARGEAPAALRDGREPWLPFALDLHPHLRALLRLRLFLRRRRAAGPGEADRALVAACQRHFDESGPAWPEALSAARLGGIAAPPGGRLTDIAYEDVARRHGVPIGALKQALFSTGGGA